MNWLKLAAPALAALLLAAPGGAQSGGFDGQKFVQAVRDRDGNEATELLEARGPAVANARDEKGETALIVAISRRDDLWTGFLLNKGADPNLAARNGETPLIAAARVGYSGAVAELVTLGAKVDVSNRMGETPLIVAVQNRHAAIAEALLELGADPDKADSAAGYSARDYAKRDTRTRELLKLIEAADAKRRAAAKPKIG
ncbi:ankyrin repeat domain-containing protein [Sphingomonas sp.]|uniref:ankyrin repeat domain-containing protein n=1 Tax=Sphingomonas sp. TaxID=28214 RepID=UPI0017DF132A|nr:ankyrin repeat domain-containing protein [Sphingomonas sp.]MBA3510447.1 ankyrin repeat domain-containing protein [Sphingomonas sp.]